MGSAPSRSTPTPPAPQKAPCPACGAFLSIPHDATRVVCGACGRAVAIKRQIS